MNKFSELTVSLSSMCLSNTNLCVHLLGTHRTNVGNKVKQKAQALSLLYGHTAFKYVTSKLGGSVTHL